jgi:hypothetical protein
MHGRVLLPQVFKYQWHVRARVEGAPLAKLAPRLQWKVRRTLAYSIHEVARILGTDLTEAELVPVFNSFAKDLDEVWSAAARHLKPPALFCTLQGIVSLSVGSCWHRLAVMFDAVLDSCPHMAQCRV